MNKTQKFYIEHATNIQEIEEKLKKPPWTSIYIMSPKLFRIEIHGHTEIMSSARFLTLWRKWELSDYRGETPLDKFFYGLPPDQINIEDLKYYLRYRYRVEAAKQKLLGKGFPNF